MILKLIPKHIFLFPKKSIYISMLRKFCVNKIEPNVVTEDDDKDSDKQIELRSPSLRLSHTPVMAKEIIQRLNPQDGQSFIDLTFGSGGHTKYLLSTGKKIRVFALDRDPLAHEKALILACDKSLKHRGQEVIPLLGRFSELQSLLHHERVKMNSIDGVIMDLGASSMQFDSPNRGFALSRDAPLDMRMDGERFPDMPTAADVVNTLDSDDLTKIFKIYGDEKLAKKYAQAIVDSRFMMKKLSSTFELANLISNISSEHSLSTLSDSLGRPTHAATKVFMALRIFVNNELNELNFGLEIIREYLKRSKIEIDRNDDEMTQDENDLKDDVIDSEIDGGKIAVLSFHSLEDRIVKRHLAGIDIDSPITQNISQRYYNSMETMSLEEVKKEMGKKWKPLNKHVILPSLEEVLRNPRSRSAKLRVALRIW